MHHHALLSAHQPERIICAPRRRAAAAQWLVALKDPTQIEVCSRRSARQQEALQMGSRSGTEGGACRHAAC